jgi:hypothetical protein
MNKNALMILLDKLHLLSTKIGSPFTRGIPPPKAMTLRRIPLFQCPLDHDGPLRVGE